MVVANGVVGGGGGGSGAVTVFSAGSAGEGIASPLDEPDESTAGYCLVFSSNCSIGNSSSSCLSTKIQS